MFEIGETYDVTMLEDDMDGKQRMQIENTYFGCTVDRVEWPLVYFGGSVNEMIVNFTSPRFVKAVPC